MKQNSRKDKSYTIKVCSISAALSRECSWVILELGLLIKQHMKSGLLILELGNSCSPAFIYLFYSVCWNQDSDDDDDVHEETEEEFLKRYAEAAAALENGALAEEGDSEDFDEEPELG